MNQQRTSIASATYAALTLALLAAATIAQGPPAATPGGPTTATASASAPTTGPTSRPLVVPRSVVHDFGPTWIDQPMRCGFSILNGGDAPLTVLQVRPTFGCRSTATFPQTVMPNQTVEIPVEVDTQRFSGPFARWVTMVSDDPTQPELRLTVRGEIRAYVEVRPPTIAFGAITDNRAAEQKIEIINQSGKPLEVSMEPRTTTRPFAYELAAVAPGERYELRVRIAPPYERGPMRDLITLKTNVTSQPTLQLPVFALVPERVDVQPVQLVFSRSAAPVAGSVSRIVQVTNYGPTPVDILKIRSEDPAATATLRALQAGRRYAIDFRAPAGYEPQRDGMAIVIETNDPQFKEIRVPLRRLDAPAPTTRSAAASTQPRPERKTEAERLIGQAPPRFALQTTTGQPLTENELLGGITVFDFFAPNCPFCAKQLPWMEQVRQQYAPRGVRFVNISQTMRGKVYAQAEIVAKLAEFGNKSELAIDNGNVVGMAMKATSLPMAFVFGQTGQIEAVIAGSRPANQQKLVDRLEQLLAIAEGRAPPPPASPGR